MADKAATALAAASAFAASDVLYGVEGANSRKFSRAVIAAGIAAVLAVSTLQPAAALTDPAPMTLAQTWNDAADTFTAFKVNVTSTASAAASLLMDLQVGGASKVSVRKDGRITIAGDLFSATALSFVGDSGGISFTANTINAAEFMSDQLRLNYATPKIAFNNDLYLLKEAANTHAWRNGTASQTGLHYDTWASATDYHRLELKTARATLSGVTGASVTATGIIPDGAVVVGVTTKVTTGLGVGGGTTGYNVGDGSDADRWGAIVGTAAGTSSDNTNWTAGTIQAFTAASDIVITAVGGNFDGTGVIYCSVQYLIGRCD